MPISEKILKEIKSLKADRPDKDLLKKVLEMEDQGISQYTKPYTSEIDNYISKAKKRGDTL